MPQKRRNCGRSKKNAGRIETVNCANCGRLVAKDKAIKRFLTKNIVEASAVKDVQDACIYSEYEFPKTYAKTFYCISCAVHRRIVRVRSNNARRIREPLFMRRQRERQEARAQQSE